MTAFRQPLNKHISLIVAFALFVTALLALPITTPAQGLALMNGGGNEPLEIDAENALEWRRNEQKYVARGNAQARRGEVTLQADTLTAFYREVDGSTEIYRIVANGKVRLTSPTEQAKGDEGVYDVDNAVIVQTGKALEITSATDRITARDSLEYWETKKIAVARGDARATRADRKVRGEILQAHFVEDQKGDLAVQRMEAFGNVCLESPNNIARGAKGDYDVPRGIAITEDDVRIAQGQNVLRGAKAEVNLKTGVSRMLARGTGVQQQRSGSGRVTGLIIPRGGEPQVNGNTGQPVRASKSAMPPCG